MKLLSGIAYICFVGRTHIVLQWLKLYYDFFAHYLELLVGSTVWSLQSEYFLLSVRFSVIYIHWTSGKKVCVWYGLRLLFWFHIASREYTTHFKEWDKCMLNGMPPPCALAFLGHGPKEMIEYIEWKIFVYAALTRSRSNISDCIR